jgi:hypothetical protein
MDQGGLCRIEGSGPHDVVGVQGQHVHPVAVALKCSRFKKTKTFIHLFLLFSITLQPLLNASQNMLHIFILY